MRQRRIKNTSGHVRPELLEHPTRDPNSITYPPARSRCSPASRWPQQRSSSRTSPPSGTTPLASASTAADGSFTTSLTLSRNHNLRALHRSAPASASAIVAIRIAPALELRIESASPLRAAGTVFPAGRTVEIDLYRLAGRHRRLIARAHAPVRRGHFSAKLAGHRPGRYAIRAVTKATVSNAPGASNELHILI